MQLEVYLHARYSPRATSGYLNLIRRFREYMGEWAQTATYQDILNYIGYLRKRELQPRTLRNHLFAIKMYYRWLHETGKREDHPCERLHLKDRVNRRIAVENLYSLESLEAFLKEYRSKSPFLQRRDQVIIGLLIYQALTVSEVAGLNVEDVNLQEGTLRIRDLVKTKGRTLPLKPNQILLFYDYLKEDRPQLAACKGMMNAGDRPAFILTKTGRRIDPHFIITILNPGKEKKRYPKRTPLKIRQSVIAHLLKSSHDLRVVQVFAGHRRSGSTEEYKQTGLEALKMLIQRLHPYDKLCNPSPHEPDAQSYRTAFASFGTQTG